MLDKILDDASVAASMASMKYFNDTLGGADTFPCGFAWVNVYGIKGNTKEGKILKSFGFRKAYEGGYQLWNPGSLNCQNVDAKEAGAKAFAAVLREFGIEAYSGSRLD